MVTSLAPHLEQAWVINCKDLTTNWDGATKKPDFSMETGIKTVPGTAHYQIKLPSSLGENVFASCKLPPVCCVSPCSFPLAFLPLCFSVFCSRFRAFCSVSRLCWVLYFFRYCLHCLALLTGRCLACAPSYFLPLCAFDLVCVLWSRLPLYVSRALHVLFLCFECSVCCMYCFEECMRQGTGAVKCLVWRCGFAIGNDHVVVSHWFYERFPL